MVPGTSAFEGVRAVQPGQIVIVERQNGQLRVQTKTYWDLNFPLLSDRHSSQPDEFYIEELRRYFIEAIQLKLEADVPVACYLSGGIDSCTILGVAAACQQSPVKAFTVGFDDRDYDETAISPEMAQAVGADQDIVTVQGGQLYEHFARAVWHTERSIYNTFTIAKMLLSEHVHNAGYPLPWQKKQSKLTPGRVAQAMGGVLAAIGTPAVLPKPRGKSPGWSAGTTRVRRIRYPTV